MRILLVLLCLLGSTFALAAPIDPDAQDGVATANDRFALDLYQQLSEKYPGESMFFSPFSISSALAMTMAGACGPTVAEMFDALGHRAQTDPTPAACESIHAGMEQLLYRFNGEAKPGEDKIREEIAGLERELADQNECASKLADDRDWRKAHQAQQEAKELADKINELRPQIDQYEIQITNALWGESSYPFSDAYIATVDRHYGSGGIFTVDFKREHKKARQKINDWVSAQTGGLIQDMISEDALSNMTRLVLTNAIYFKGQWEKPFDEGNTQTRDFHLAGGGTEPASLMQHPRLVSAYGAFNGDGSVFATPDVYVRRQTEGLYPGPDGFAIIELPYRGGEISMVVIAPNCPEGLPNVEKILTAETLVGWLASLEQRETEIYLPRFKLETSYHLRETLQAMGMKLAFLDPGTGNGADFSGMYSSENPGDALFISKVFHKAFVEVNELGTEAAAATIIDTMLGGLVMEKEIPFKPVFRADRPFLFLIRDRVTDTLLFIGRLTRP